MILVLAAFISPVVFYLVFALLVLSEALGPSEQEWKPRPNAVAERRQSRIALGVIFGALSCALIPFFALQAGWLPH